MTQPLTANFEGACSHALNRLEHELAGYLSYHALQHTSEDVLPAIERLAQLEGVTGEALWLLRTAATYHDIGYLEQYVGHEEVGIRITSNMLPHFGYSLAQISIVTGIIRATRFPQSPHNLLESIMADADLDSLGRSDYWSTSEALRKELAAIGRSFTDTEWFQAQYNFLTQHSYFTRAARRLRTAGKESNIRRLALKLSE